MKRNIHNTEEEEYDFKEDCPAFPYNPTVLPPTNRIIVMGDIHGDLKLLVSKLKKCSLIQQNCKLIL